MAEDGFLPTHGDVVRTQLTRLDIVNILQESNIEQLLESCFVRVLLEIETGHEDYRVFTIKAVNSGTPYRGFSADTDAETDLYVDLNLPSDLRGINGIAFQLNSISNSRVTDGEYAVWRQSPGPQRTETRAAYVARLQRLQNHQKLANRRQVGTNPALAAQYLQQHIEALHALNTAAAAGDGAATPPPSHNPHFTGAAGSPSPPPANDGGESPAVANLASATMGNAEATVRQHVPQGGGGTRGANAASAIPDAPTKEAALRAVMDELREQYVVVVNPDYPDHKTSLLRTAECDVSDYIDTIKDKLNHTRESCVVCFDRPSTVITLPCKHKVLCRLCASQVNHCPVCRETAVQAFEPIEA